MGAVSADRVAAVVELRRTTEEATVLRARVDGLRKQLEQARVELAEAARLREELDATWAKKMNASTVEAARLREQLAAARPDSPAAPAEIGADNPPPAPTTPPLTEQAELAAPAGGGLDVGVKKAALSGAVWTVLGYGGVQCLRFVSNLILTRLLAPRLFGLMALVNLFVLGLHMFSDLGLLQAVIHSKRGEDTDFLNTAWTLQVMRGLTLWVCSLLIAWPASWFYGEPALCWLIPLAGLTAAINGFNSTAVFRLSRQLVHGRVVLLEIGTYIVSTGFIITSVWLLGRGAAEGDPTLRTKQLLALVAGSIVASLFEMTMSYCLSPGFRHRFRWDRTATPELLHFGGWIFVSTGCMFLASQADRLVVGKMSVELLGVYHVAATLANMPMVLIMSMSSQLISPLYSRLVNSGADLRTTFGGIHRTAAAFGGLLATGMVVAGPTAIRCLYDTRYAEAGQYLQLLTVAVWFTMLQSTSERVLMVRGKTRKMAVAQVAKLILLPVLLLVGFRLGGLGGMILGFASAEAGRYALITCYLHREGFSVLLCDVVFSVLVVAFAGIVLAVGPLLWGAWPKFAAPGVGNRCCPWVVVRGFPAGSVPVVGPVPAGLSGGLACARVVSGAGERPCAPWALRRSWNVGGGGRCNYWRMGSRRWSWLESLACRAARSIGVCAQARTGPEGLASRWPLGPRPRLSDEQLAELVALLEQGAAAHGWPDSRWTARRVADLVERSFGLRFHPEHVRKMLKERLGWSTREPQQRGGKRQRGRRVLWRQA